MCFCRLQKTSLHFLQQEARAGENVEHVLADWLAWLFCFLPLAHAVRLMDCYLMEGEKVRVGGRSERSESYVMGESR